MRENYLCVVYHSGLMQAPLMTVCTCTWLFEDLWALQKFKVTLTDSLNYMNWCVISSELEKGWASSFPPTSQHVFHNYWDRWNHSWDFSPYSSSSSTDSILFCFFVFFLKSNQHQFVLHWWSGAILWGKQCERRKSEGHSGGERYCHAWGGCMLWGMTRWLRQKTGNKRRGQTEWWG